MIVLPMAALKERSFRPRGAFLRNLRHKKRALLFLKLRGSSSEALLKRSALQAERICGAVYYDKPH